MNRSLWHIIFVCCIIGLVSGGVKIEITRVKEPPKPVSIGKTGDIDSSTLAVDSEPTETTTLMTTSPLETTTTTTTTATTTKIAIDSIVPKLTNSTPSSSSNTSELTTISQINATQPIQLKPAQTNTSNISSVLVNNVTLSYANDLNPYLSEFTRRQMRRKLIPEDYYCPCDLKVNNPVIIIISS